MTAKAAQIKFHPAAERFELLSDGDLAALADDIRKNGLLVPIVLYQGKILDGRNRYLACQIAGVAPRFEEWEPETKVGKLESFLRAKSYNLMRRQMGQEQIAAVMRLAIEDLPELKQKIDAIKDEATKREKAGKGSDGSGGRGKTKTLGSCDPRVLTGTKASEQIAAIIGVSAPTYKRIEKLAKQDMAALVDVAKGVTSATKAGRKVKAEQISRKLDWPKGKYRIIYADPPWSYGNTQPDYHAEQRDHYPVMSLDAICEMPVKSLSLDDAVLFLWVTSPVLEESFQVIRAWGFKYKASFVWDKIKHNMGHYNSVRHEFLLVAVRGSCQPDVAKLFDSVVTEERTKHSRKPAVFYEVIDTIYPNGPRIELFARTSRQGWSAYGHETK